MTQLNVSGSARCISVEQVAGMGWVVKFMLTNGQTLELIGNEADVKPDIGVGKDYNLVLDAMSIKRV